MKFEDINVADFLSRQIKQTERVMEFLDNKEIGSSIIVKCYDEKVEVVVGGRQLEIPGEFIEVDFKEMIRMALERNRQEKKKELRKIGVEVA